jgi:hypothetical protein
MIMPVTMFRVGIAGLATAALMAICAPASAEVVNLKADLKGTNEVPPNTSKASGNAMLTYDTGSKKLEYTVNYSGMSGNVTGAHFHGPATADKNAGVVLPLKGDLAKSPIKGEATLTDAQAADLTGGRLYMNLHTAAHPGGEIRGQVTK